MEGGQRSQLPSHVQGHLTADHVDLAHTRVHDCDEKAVSISHDALVLSKLMSVFFFLFLFQVIMHNQQRISTTL